MNTDTILPTKNESWGFWGSISHHADAAEAWPLAMRTVAEATSCPATAVRAFLDSPSGRHFADDVTSGLALGMSLEAAIKAAATVWMTWTIDRRTEREHGIPRGLPYLTGFVAHFEIMTKTYSSRSNAKRAAVADLGPDAMEGADYHLIRTGNRWGWTTEPRPEPAPEPEGNPDIEEDVAAAEAGFAKPKTNIRHREGTKQAKLIEMLKRPQGATIPEITAAFGWLPHTSRGVIAGALKKKLGLTIISEKTEARGRTYRIAE